MTDNEQLDQRVRQLEAQLAAARAERSSLEQLLAADAAKRNGFLIDAARKLQQRNQAIVGLMVLSGVSTGMVYLMWLVHR